MYASEIVVGARSHEAVEQALRLALPSLGLGVHGVADVSNVSELWEKRQHEPSIAVGAISDGIHAVHVRGPRSPSWNNELARRLSQHLGGWGAAAVNDRLLDEYGYGYFLDGLVVEAATRLGPRVIERAGFLPEVPDRVILDSLDEERNGRQFRAALLSLAGPYVTSWPPSGSIRVFFVEGDGITTTELPRPASNLVVAAGHRDRIDLPGYEHDILVDGADVKVLLARTVLPHWELAERIDAVACVAFFTDGARTFVKRSLDADIEEEASDNLRTALSTWEPVCSTTRTAPMGFTFDAVRPMSPWR